MFPAVPARFCDKHRFRTGESCGQPRR